MRKGFMGIISLVLAFCLVLAGCGSAQAKDSGSEEAVKRPQRAARKLQRSKTPQRWLLNKTPQRSHSKRPISRRQKEKRL